MLQPDGFNSLGAYQNVKKVSSVIIAVEQTAYAVFSPKVLKKYFSITSAPSFRNGLYKYIASAPRSKVGHLYEPDHFGEAGSKLFSSKIIKNGSIVFYLKRSKIAPQPSILQAERGVKRHPWITRAILSEKGAIMHAKPRWAKALAFGASSRPGQGLFYEKREIEWETPAARKGQFRAHALAYANTYGKRAVKQSQAAENKKRMAKIRAAARAAGRKGAK